MSSVSAARRTLLQKLPLDTQQVEELQQVSKPIDPLSLRNLAAVL